jgi:hypothetical protein
MITLSDAYVQFLDKRWSVLLIAGGILVVVIIILVIMFSGGGSVDRDIQRVHDVEVLQEVLTKYYVSEGKYPTALKELVPKFIAKTRVGFTKADGTCKIGGYVYKKYQSQNAYDITFCLGTTVGTLAPGNHIATPYGIK